jgi:hypothetical protein
MKNILGSTRIFGRAALVALLAAPALGAQGRWEDSDRRDDRDRWEDNRGRGNSRDRRDRDRELFTWRGVVDHDTRIYMRGRQVQTQVVTSRGTYDRGRVTAEQALPRREGTVRINMIEGRGRVYVLQQPSARNNYTAILRVSDIQGGSDRYRFVAYFDDDDRNGGPIWGDNGGDVYGRNRVLRWSGSVDGDTRISLSQNDLNYHVVAGGRPQNVRSSLGQTMQRRDGQLEVQVRQGRGSVSVVQQPSMWNNYTAIVRVLDSPGGYGFYDFDVVSRY